MSNVRVYRLGCVLLPLAFAVLAAGCSEDDPTTPPVDIAPSSAVFQISVAADGTAFAAGREGAAGMLYTKQGGIWSAYGNQPGGTAVTGVLAATTATQPPALDLYVFVQPNKIFHLENGLWAGQAMNNALTSGLLKETATGRWSLGPGGILLGENAGLWSTILNVDGDEAVLTDVAERDDGSLFVSQYYAGLDFGRIHRFTPELSYVIDEVDAQIFALASTSTDTVWAAGRSLLRFTDASWETVVSIPDSNLVVAIGRPGDGSLVLVCELGAIYRWQNNELSTVQELNLLGPLTSACYVDESTIYGCLNFIESNTGHLTGIVVRFDGDQWVTEFLAPPERKAME